MKAEKLHSAKIVKKEIMLALIADYDLEMAAIKYYEKYHGILEPAGLWRESHGEETCNTMRQLRVSGKLGHIVHDFSDQCNRCPFWLAVGRGLIIGCDEPNEDCKNDLDAGLTVVEAAIEAAFN